MHYFIHKVAKTIFTLSMLTSLVAMAPYSALAYSEGGYYGQASYYSQSAYYAQSYYQSSYYYQSAYAADGTPEGTQLYGTPGTYQFTVPTGVTSIKVFLIGGGGGGGGGAADWGGGGGGGCGGAITGQTLTVTPGQTYSVTVGVGGAGGPGGAQNGASGSASYFGSISAAGGSYGGRGYYGYPNTTAPAGGTGGGSGGGGGGNAYPGFYAVTGNGGTAGTQTNSAGSGGKCTGSGWAVNAQTYITRASFAVGSGGYAPAGVYAYCGGGGGGGITINGSTVGGTSGYAPTTSGYGPGCQPNGGAGYGGGGGGAFYANPGYGGAGAPGAVYIEWTPVYPPTCSISISPNPASYSYNGTATLTWSATNANTSMYINSVGYVSGSSGSFTVPRTATASYSGTATGSGGTATCPATLTVTAPSASTATITSSLGNTIQLGQSTTITASFTAASGDSITAANIDSPVGTGLGANTNPGTKTYTFTPSVAGTYTFYARAQTSYFTSWATYNSVTVTVQAPCTLGGITLQSGQSATFYTNQVAPTGQLCSSIAQTRTCTNGVLSGSASYQYASCTCAPIYSCSGNNVMYTNSSCSTSTAAVCIAPNYCSPGVSTCVTPPPTFNAGSGTNGHLQVRPQVVRSGTTASVYWNVSNVSSCTVSGSNGDSWTGGSGAKTTAAISQRTTYTLACTGLDGSRVNETAVVNVTPSFQER